MRKGASPGQWAVVWLCGGLLYEDVNMLVPVESTAADMTVEGCTQPDELITHIHSWKYIN